MKKIIALILMFTMLMALGACGTTATSTTSTTKATTRATTTTKKDTYKGMSDDEVLEDAAFALEHNLDSALKRDAGCAYVKYISVGSIKLIENERWGYEVLAKGTFSAYDEYGDFEGEYKFEAIVSGFWNIDVTIIED